ncbi:MAG: T9SS type A sorting domain-containing protein, partial [Bacteroidia bacterium]
NPGPYIYSATVQHPGRGGAGGKGGYTHSRASLSETKKFDLDSPYSYCPPQPAGCIQEVCNCDSVMRAFQHMNNTFSTCYYYPAPGLDSFVLNSSPVVMNSKNYVTYRRSTGQFKYRMYHDPLLLDCYTDHYCYVFDSLDCFRAVDAFSYLRHNVHFSHTKLKAELVGSDVHFEDDSFRLNFVWSSSDQILYDVLTPTQPRCYAATCNPNSPGNPDHPSRGGEGSTGFGSQEVPLYQNDTGNLYFFTGVSGPMPENNKNGDIRLAWQNDGEVLQLTARGEVDIWQAAVYDLSGRLRLHRTALNRSDAGLDMKSLSPGVYLLHIQSSHGDRYVKICKP